jgi:cytochrome P450
MSNTRRQRFLKMNAINFMAERFDRLGDTFVQGDYLHTRDPELAHRALVVDAALTRRVANPLAPLLGETMTLLDGERWLARRKLLLPAFRAALTSHPDVVRPMVARALETWGSTEHELYRALRVLMLQITAKSLLGWEPANAVVTALLEPLEQVTELGSLLRTSSDNGETWAAVRSQLDSLVDVQGCDSPILSALRSGQSAGELTEDEVRQEIYGLLLAGQDTVVLTLLLALWFASRSSEELHLTEGRHRHLQEVLRLYPPAYAIPRFAVQPLGPVAAEQQLIIWSYFIHRSEQLFEAPLEFRSERWKAGKPVPGAYLPFGLGGHRCLGERLALSTLEGALEVLQSHLGRLRWLVDALPPLLPYVSLTPTEPIPVRWSA